MEILSSECQWQKFLQVLPPQKKAARVQLLYVQTLPSVLLYKKEIHDLTAEQNLEV